MNKKKLNKKELFFSIMIPIMIITFLITLFFPTMENYWLRMLLMIGTMIIVNTIVVLTIHWFKLRQTFHKDNQ